MVRLTDNLDITIVIDWDVKPQAKQKKVTLVFCKMAHDARKSGPEAIKLFPC